MKAIKIYGTAVLGLFFYTQASTVEAAPRHVSTQDATAAIDEVKAYVRGGAPAENTIRIYDLVAGKDVVLGLRSIHEQDLRPLTTNRLAVCSEFLSQDGAEYMIWFVVQKGITNRETIGGVLTDVPYPNKSRVKDLLIHKVNGIARVEWSENEEGQWAFSAVDEAVRQASSHQHELSESVGQLDSADNAVCPECGSHTQAKSKKGVQFMKHRCSSCKKKFDYVPYWYYKTLIPFKRVHVCDQCDTLVELCPVCIKKK